MGTPTDVISLSSDSKATSTTSFLEHLSGRIKADEDLLTDGVVELTDFWFVGVIIFLCYMWLVQVCNLPSVCVE